MFATIFRLCKIYSTARDCCLINVFLLEDGGVGLCSTLLCGGDGEGVGIRSTRLCGGDGECVGN